MYSVVLMAALATSSSAPDFGHCHGWGHGCHGGYGYCSGYGACYGCYGWACYGSGGYGCYAGWGGYGYGCYGYCTGWGCYGSWGASPYAVWGCYGVGAGYGVWCGGGPGCYGGYSCYGMVVPGTTVAPNVTPGYTAPVTPGAPAPEVTPEPKKKGEQARAKVRIEVPEDAKLYVDGVLMKTGSSVRTYQTPDLLPSQTYYYELKAELARNGQTFSETQRIIVRPGQLSTASFAGLEQRAAAAAAKTPLASAQQP